MLQELERFLHFTSDQKARTLIRSDAGFGSDYNVDYALDEDWQILTKGFGGKRTKKLVQAVPEAAWMEVSTNRWVTRALQPPPYLKPVQYLLLRWVNEKEETKYASLICSVLDWSMPQVVDNYTDRGRCETQIQADKGGLKMGKRRKTRRLAQEALILLTDLAHNLLSWISVWMFPQSHLASFGTTRWVEDVLLLPGRLVFDDQDHLLEIHLNRFHPHAEAVADGLHRLLERFGYP